MKTVKILCGGYSYTSRGNDGLIKHSVAYRGDSASVSDEEAARLVGLGVAAYADAPNETANTPPAPPSDGGEPENEYQDTTGTEPPAESAAEGGNSGTYSAEVKRLERMPKDDLARIAQDMGVDISGARNNHERAGLIAAAMSGEGEDGEDDDAPPDLEDEDIVR